MLTPRVIAIAQPVDFVALAAARPLEFPYLLESVTAPDNQRFDLLFVLPGEQRVLENQPGIVSSARVAAFLTELDAFIQPELTPQALPFCGGWFVYLGYEIAAGIERKLKLPAHASRFPIAFAQRMRAALVRDHVKQTTYWVTEGNVERGELPDLTHSAIPATRLIASALQEDPPLHYLHGVARIAKYIAEGDVFQVNLSRGWSALAPQARAAALYAQLRASNPAPFAGLVVRPEGAIVSSSPERLIELANGWATTRPIAGTRPRLAGQDERVSAELLTHPKERAEHIMLIDLERNDLGRVCETGSVEVTELMVVEHYAHVLHIVSNVRGRLRDGVSPMQAVQAVFPGGTITGCPKVRCMQIISELEQTGRGPYTGSMGYVSLDGRTDLNILIRTMLLSDGVLSFRTGAGIVTDSEPLRELDETRAKALGLLNALKA